MIKNIILLILITLLFSNVSKGQYPSVSGGNDSYDWITKVVFQGINNPSTAINPPTYPGTSEKGASGYTDYTGISQTVVMVPGNSYTITINAFSDIEWSSLYAYLYVWCDWDRDYNFDDANEGPFKIADHYALPAPSVDYHHQYTGTITVPSPMPSPGSAPKVLMRVIYCVNSPAEVPQKNQHPSYGEAEDYSLEPSILPVELNSFSALSKNNLVVVSWTTVTEVNNYGFEIERKNTEWEKIGFVPGHGNSNSPKQYTFKDEKPLTTPVQYRLKQIDNDGAYKYYEPVDVKGIKTEFSLLQNYPNPFNPSTKIEYTLPFDGSVRLAVYNTLGEEVKVLHDGLLQAGYHESVFDAGYLTSGMYFYSITASSSDGKDKYSSVKKMILLR